MRDQQIRKRLKTQGSKLKAHKKEGIPHQGRLFIISAPSGAGKTTLCKAVLGRFADMSYSISHTTRLRRAGEQDGVDYYFISKEEFKKKIKEDKWAEWAEVHDNFYGTSAEFMDKNLSLGRDVLLDIDVQGTAQILKRYPDSVTIFIMPPSLDVLKKRLESRGADSRDTIVKRIKNAENELAKKDLYRHVIVNDKLSEAVDQLLSIIKKYRSGRDSKV